MGKGAYTDTEQYILFCAVNKYEIRNFKKIVNEIDPKAFVTISEDQEIDGGFEKRLWYNRHAKRNIQICFWE